MQGNEIEADLTSRQKLIFEAALKMQKGKALYEEGKLEFDNLTLDKKPKKAAKSEKVIAHRTARVPQASTFKKEKPDEAVRQRIVDFLASTRSAATTKYIGKKLRIGPHQLQRVLKELEDEKTIKDKWTGKQGSKHAWELILVEEKSSRRGQEPVPPQENAEKVFAFIRENDWVNKRKLDKIGLSRNILDRTLDFLTKEGRIKVVEKAQNPAHEKIKKVYVQKLPYYEVK